MKRSNLKINEIEELHRNGQLEDAKKGYLEILASNPNEVDVLHRIALIFAEEGSLEESQRYLEKAIELKPDEPGLYLHLANIYKAKELFNLAEQVLFNVIEIHPKFAAAYNNLGTVLYAQKKWNEAAEAYQAALDLQSNYIDAYYNLGLALIKAEKREEALNVYENLLLLASQHAGARFQLACILMQQGKYKKAIEHFYEIEKQHPFHAETQVNLASSLLHLGQVQEAKQHYLKALEITPNDTQITFNLGVISAQLSEINDVIKYYVHTLKLDNNYFAAHNNLAIAYLLLRDSQNALLHFREALRLDPNNESIQHLINIVTRDKEISNSPPEYIRSLFDSYADHYDAHMLQLLSYKGHYLLLSALEQVAKPPQYGWDILDLGCGTGLCGDLFKPYAKTLVGIDLSANMIEIAAKKNIYDDLVESDVLVFLNQLNTQYDLILAGDVLTYFGDLAAFFASMQNALKPGAYFVFTAEITDKEYSMTASGRFAHAKKYLDELITKNQMEIVYYSADALRMQNQQAVAGHVYVAKKTR